jgi:hypothetical protein
MATRANAAVNVCYGTRLRPENIQAAYAGSEENREPLWLTTVEQDASAFLRFALSHVSTPLHVIYVLERED